MLAGFVSLLRLESGDCDKDYTQFAIEGLQAAGSGAEMLKTLLLLGEFSFHIDWRRANILAIFGGGHNGHR